MDTKPPVEPAVIADLSTLDPNMLQRSLDIAKTAAFLGKTGAFLGTILCATPWIWSKELDTAGTDAYSIVCDPHWWLKLPKATQAFILLHEIWHIAALHRLRRGHRDHRVWNIACDIWINNRLRKDGYTNVGFDGWFRAGLPDEMTEEEIYDLLMEEAGYDPDHNFQESPWGMVNVPNKGPTDVGDLIPPVEEEEDDAGIIHRVVSGIVAQQTMSSAANLPPAIEKLVNIWLKPVVPWESALQRWLTELQESGHTWRRPNRRYSDMYLPSRTEEDGKLRNIRAYIDVSGSIDAAQATRFFSEMRFVKDWFKPDTLTLVQFDDNIRCEDVIGPDQTIEKIELVGRGGTDLEPVRKDIEEHRPSAVIIFTDGGCNLMGELSWDCPLIWIIIRGPHHQPIQGKTFHIMN